MNKGDLKVGLPPDMYSRRRNDTGAVGSKGKSTAQIAEELSGVEKAFRDSVVIDLGEPQARLAKEVTNSITWKDRAIPILQRAKVDAYYGMVIGGIIGLGAIIGTGLSVLLTMTPKSPEAQKGFEAIIVGAGLAVGVGSGMGAGLGARVDIEPLVLAGIAAIATDAWIILGTYGTAPIESSQEMINLAISVAGAATAAAFVVGVVTSVATGLYLRRNLRI